LRRGGAHSLRTEPREVNEDEKALQEIYEAGDVQVIVYLSRQNRPVYLCIACAQTVGKHPAKHKCNEKVRETLAGRLAKYEGDTHVEKLWAWVRRLPDRPNFAAPFSRVEGVTLVALEPETRSEEVDDVTMDFGGMDLEEQIDADQQMNMEGAGVEELPLIERLQTMTLQQTEREI